ncbi:ABC transporter ATP-binding protein [Macrococcoides caseolyticum]|uniref:ABC transporter ATP-binding protein n=1 Tax=Macrococcoides caseolyticum TaxID=69966 RepID=UPI001F2F4B84|nr:ABC transporter ATP-binding protein [Macrococcus caseolyticus]MCE4956624.1 ABC transporter ATP-binding protein [Macrococcus caseolyticus]
MAKEVLKLENVNKYKGKAHIIKDLSFSVYAGEVYGFLGPNGAGKTSTIRMIVGLNKPSSGSIFINGHDIQRQFKKAIRGVGAIVENPELYGYLSGYDNLVHFAKMNDNVTKERIEEVVALVGLTDAIHMKVRQYSLGMRQRLGIAVSILHRPSVLILDEPTNGLDPAGIKEIRHYIRNLAEKEGVAVIVSSHLLSEIEMMCDRICVIKDGKLVTIQDLNDVSQAQQYKYVLKAAPIDKANAIISKLPFVQHQAINHEMIEMNIDEEDVPKLIHQLSHEKVSMYAFYREKLNLEARFFEMIGGEHNE